MSTISSYTGDGSTKQFDITFAYDSASTVKARVAGVDVTYTFVSPTRVALTTAPATGALVEIYRKTPVTSPVVDFTDGAVLQAADLDQATLQVLRRAEELSDELATLKAAVVRIPDGTGTILAGASGRHSKFLGFDAAGAYSLFDATSFVGATGATGATGPSGRTILNGSGAPGAGLGSDGDYYINNSTHDLYGPKTAGAWGSPVSLIGPSGSGSVSSVGLALPAQFTVTGSPVTGSGVLTAAWANETANLVFASPNGSTGVPTFRALVTADLGSATANFVLAAPNGSAGNSTFRALVAADLPMATATEAKAGSSTKPLGVDVLWSMQAEQTLTDAAPTAWDMSLGPNAKWTVAANRTLSTPTNPRAGAWYTLRVIQDATGSHTVTWPASFNWGTAGAPTLTTTATKHDLISLYCTDAATPAFDVFLGGKGF